jgi:hypothetical protein
MQDAMTKRALLDWYIKASRDSFNCDGDESATSGSRSSNSRVCYRSPCIASWHSAVHLEELYRDLAGMFPWCDLVD